jgi:Tat protein secretion system quality control protein TatD with DNase activity
MNLNNINYYSTYSEKKASVVERFNRTLKEKMWKQFSMQGSYKWIDILPKLVNEYNNTRHRTIGMKPSEVNKKNEQILLETVNKIKNMSVKPKYKIGDKVRISK